MLLLRNMCFLNEPPSVKAIIGRHHIVYLKRFSKEKNKVYEDPMQKRMHAFEKGVVDVLAVDFFAVATFGNMSIINSNNRR